MLQRNELQQGCKYVFCIELTTSCPILWGGGKAILAFCCLCFCHSVLFEPVGRDYNGAAVLFSTYDLKAFKINRFCLWKMPTDRCWTVSPCAHLCWCVFFSACGHLPAVPLLFCHSVVFVIFSQKPDVIQTPWQIMKLTGLTTRTHVQTHTRTHTH